MEGRDPANWESVVGGRDPKVWESAFGGRDPKVWESAVGDRDPKSRKSEKKTTFFVNDLTYLDRFSRARSS